jgi:hypothetical protein
VAGEPESRLEWAKRPFGPIFALAVASRTAPEPLRTLSLGTAAAALRAWAGVYRPTGNPIDEWFFLPLMHGPPAADPRRGHHGGGPDLSASAQWP